MRDCPKCQAFVDGLSCHKCGYSEDGSSKGKALADPYHGCCSWIDRGERCREPWVWSPNTLGTGPWYCRAHRHGLVAAKPFQPTAGHFQQLRDALLPREPGCDDV